MNVNKLLQRSYNAWKRPLALLMAFLMIIACLPVNGYVYADSETYSIDVTIIVLRQRAVYPTCAQSTICQ